MKICNKCNLIFPDQTKYCNKCGSITAYQSASTCPFCGSQYNPFEKYCRNCGAENGRRIRNDNFKLRRVRKWPIVLFTFTISLAFIVFIAYLSTLQKPLFNTQTDPNDNHAATGLKASNEKTSANKPDQTKSVQEIWEGTLTGIYEKFDGNYSPCLGSQEGAFSENHTLSITFTTSIENFPTGKGFFSANETILRKAIYDGYQLQPSSSDNVPIYAAVGLDDSRKYKEILIKTQENSLWVSRSTVWGSVFTAPHNELYLTVTSDLGSTISGTWKSSPFGAHGEFTLTKK